MNQEHMNWQDEARRVALGIRCRVLDLTIERNGCYLSQALSSAEILAVLYTRVLQLEPSMAPACATSAPSTFTEPRTKATSANGAATGSDSDSQKVAAATAIKADAASANHERRSFAAGEPVRAGCSGSAFSIRTFPLIYSIPVTSSSIGNQRLNWSSPLISSIGGNT